MTKQAQSVCFHLQTDGCAQSRKHKLLQAVQGMEAFRNMQADSVDVPELIQASRYRGPRYCRHVLQSAGHEWQELVLYLSRLALSLYWANFLKTSRFSCITFSATSMTRTNFSS